MTLAKNSIILVSRLNNLLTATLIPRKDHRCSMFMFRNHFHIYVENVDFLVIEMYLLEVWFLSIEWIINITGPTDK